MDFKTVLKEIEPLLRQSNLMTMKRLGYNDHGPTHARIVMQHGLKLYRLTYAKGEWPSVRDLGYGYKEGRIVVGLAALLHDLGNSVHRDNHEFWSGVIAWDLLKKWVDDPRLRTEILHAIYSHERLNALTLEASCVKVADALDMTKGRARIPSMKGRFSIHSASADAIQSVKLRSGEERLVIVEITMENPAGIFQIDHLLIPRIKQSVLKDQFELLIHIGDKTRRLLV